MLYKRKGSPYWWLKIQQNGRKIQESTRTEDRKKAEEYHDKLKYSLWEQDKLGAKPKYKWEDAVIKWITETNHKASHYYDLIHLRWLDLYFRGRTLSDLSRQDIDLIIQQRLAEGVKNSTVNRMLAVVRAIFRKAVNEWEWIDKYPNIKLLPEPRGRIRWLSKPEAERLLKELPEHLNVMARFTLETGLRRSNVTGLTWSQVDLERRRAWIHPDQAKARKAISVPLSDNAVNIIQSQLGKNKEYVFTYKGNKVINVGHNAWRKALKRAGIENFRWHDLRHTWASWHVMNETPLNVLKELGGWSDMEMVLIYAHLSPDHLAAYAGNATKK